MALRLSRRALVAALSTAAAHTRRLAGGHVTTVDAELALVLPAGPPMARRGCGTVGSSPILAGKGPTMTDGMVATTARALASSRLLSPPAPIARLRLIRGV